MAVTLVLVTNVLVCGASIAGPTAAYWLALRPLMTRAQKLPPGVPRVAHPTARAGVRELRTALRLSRSARARFLASRINFSPPAADFELPAFDFAQR